MNKESTAVDLAQQAAAGDNFTAAYDIKRIRAELGDDVQFELEWVSRQNVSCWYRTPPITV